MVVSNAVIMHLDDEEIARELVAKSLEAKGYTVHSLDGSRSNELTNRLPQLLNNYGEPDIFILDGHNILRDEYGNQLYDMTPLGIIPWLIQRGVPATCKFILYSNDDKLVEQARINRRFKFFEAVPKAGAEGGILVLIQAVVRATQTK
jgi:CheY-like chemotaxis protein